ncbi:MAG: tRNA (guanosine(46)-N7)-methyltransferase TrmB [Prevotellaceae bacterium]|jgi:tRNA (guanine-N7-)-methyltransferase|nr:tRNA (guanosine(46)-N7)-methyltransferase TrmB [Prevotellaceae bacterium]
MGKDKLRKFRENLDFPHLFQPRIEEADEYRGRWSERFGNANPVVLELGCGKGEYTVALSRRFPERNYIGIDIKGARIWRGAKTVDEEQIPNAAFLRIRIEFAERFFAPDEVDEIWITFPDPQVKKPRKRLTSQMFIERYRKFLKPGGTIHLKTDSRMLHDYTAEIARANGFELLHACTDIRTQCPDDEMQAIRTFYEMQFASRGIPITYLKFKINEQN